LTFNKKDKELLRQKAGPSIRHKKEMRMGHENYSRQEDVKGSSDRSFGLIFAAAFAIIGTLPLLAGRSFRLWALIVTAAFVLTALAAPQLFAPFNRLWTLFGLMLHRAVSPIMLGIMFFLVVTPIGLLMRTLGKQPLRLNFDKSAASYWIDRTPPGPAPESLKDQF
jgi:hypothetical protein